MSGDENFYAGGDYGLDPDRGDFLGMSYRTPAGKIGLATDARTANQIAEVSTKLNTGAKTIEISAVQPDVFESIPNQHLEELNRLRKLVGNVDFTVHGPLVEPTGVTKNGWEPSQRENAERQIFMAVERSHMVNPDGNVVVTFHASNGLPEPETKVKTMENGKMVEKTTGMYIVDERTGQFSNLVPKEHHLLRKPADAMNELKELNEQNWFRTLSHANFQAHQGRGIVHNALIGEPEERENPQIRAMLKSGVIEDYYGKQGTAEGQKILETQAPELRPIIEDRILRINHGEVYVKDAFSDLRSLFDQAYDYAKNNADKDSKIKEDFERLDEFSKQMVEKQKLINDPTRVNEFSNVILQGMKLLGSLSSTPQTFKPLKEFAIEKSAETFGNAAYKAYKEFGDKSPIISIENPPAGMGIHRAQDMTELIEKSQDKFVKQAVKDGISESEAKKQAEKLIGATWDVGHINMIRKYGYDATDVVGETKKIASHIKHVHLSDNFGMEHTELPMGMGNVPTKQHMEIIDGYNKQVKKIIETGQWYQHFKYPPFTETLASFGSPVYPMKMAPYWNQAVASSGAYFAGYGMNPDIHHSVYGSGFSTLPVELGGQMSGRSRASGAPIE